MESNQPHTLVIAVDGLRASALGAYGATAHSTPGLDKLTAESVTYDWCYADSPDRLLTYKSIEQTLFQGDFIHNNSLLVTDSTDLLESSFAKAFATVKPIEVEDSELVAESIGDTQLAKSMAVFAEKLSSYDSKLTDSKHPFFAWLDLQGFYGPWDAPVELGESLLDEEDPRFEILPTPPQASQSGVEEEDWCDARFAAVCRYAAQTMVLDACIDSLMEFMATLFERETYRVLLVGLRGYPLGEHGQIGGVDTRLYSEQQQIPLLFRSDDPKKRYTRQRSRCRLSDALGAELATSVATSQDEKSSPIVLASPDGTRMMLNKDWLLRSPAASNTSDEISDSESAELYLKPDDRWEQNDVASLKPEVVKSMLALIDRP